MKENKMIQRKVKTMPPINRKTHLKGKKRVKNKQRKTK